MTTDMRILTVRQPWAWAIIHGGKDVENRVRNVAGDYRGPVAIHVGLTWDGSPYDHPLIRDAHVRVRDESDGLSLTERDMQQMEPTRGHIIGVVNLYAVHRDADGGNCCPHKPVGGPGGSPWAEREVWHLCLANPRPLRTPIPFTGALGLRRLDSTTIDLIQKELP